MTEVAARVASDSDPTRLAYLLVFSLFLIVALLKAGAAPFFQWMPDTYAGLPAGLAAFFSALLTKVGIYVALRIGVTVFPLQAQVLAPAVQWIAVASVFIGVFAALGQSDLKRLLAFHSVSQIGLILFGVGLAYEGREGLVELAVASVVLFVLHHSAVKSSLFAMSAAYERVGGSSSLNAVRGWTSRAPWFALLFLVAAFSLAGLPPSSGFMAKWKLMMGVALEGRLVVLAILVASGLLTLASMLKIWKLSLSGPSNLPRTEASQATLRSLVVPLFVFVAMSVGMIVFYRPLLDWVDRVGYELANPANYLKAVVDQGTQQWQLREQGR
jgi:multicomponent Na+:H+ antiporter subunit D